MTYPKLPFLVRPYFLSELPGWGRLWRALGISGLDNTDPRWRQAPSRTIRGKLHGLRMKLELSDDVDRSTYFLGRYYDLEIQLMLDALLRSGDTFIDIGANIGNHVLHAAARVGSTGRVIAFEPQPACCQRLRENVEVNGLTNVELHEMALSDEPGELTLKVLGGGTIMATFAADPEVDTWVRQEIVVPVGVGDEQIPETLAGRVVVKIDVEGFELFVARGLVETIARHRPFILIEFEPRYFERAGVKQQDVLDFFQQRGYRAYDIALRKSLLSRGRLKLTPVDTLAELAALEGTIDLLWVPPGDHGFNPAAYA